MSENQESIVITQVVTYWEIASENYEESIRVLEKGKRPNDDGGFIITYDPHRKSLKTALISIVFYGMWLEAALNLTIANNKGKSDLERVKMKTLDEKIKYLGCKDSYLIQRVKNFSKEIRGPIVHEKAHLDQEKFKIAQKEALTVHELMKEMKFYLIQYGL